MYRDWIVDKCVNAMICEILLESVPVWASQDVLVIHVVVTGELPGEPVEGETSSASLYRPAIRRRRSFPASRKGSFTRRAAAWTGSRREFTPAS